MAADSPESTADSGTSRAGGAAPEARFRAAWAGVGLRGDPAPAWADLVARHAAPGRHWHTLAHVEDAIAQLHRHRPPLAFPLEAELALWYHDAVYVPGASDNEGRSAALADEALAGASLHPPARARIVGLILDTAHHGPATTPDGAAVADADLAILGAEPGRYEQYRAAVRREFEALDDAAWRGGRRAWIDRMLARPGIFQTAAFRAPLEAPARRNLERERGALAD